MATTTMTDTVPTQERPRWLTNKVAWGISPALLILLGIMALSVALHFINISGIGDANAYYTAAVESMLQSWENFFYASAEPGGSVTVDKPPLGLWIEAVSAFFLGVSGFSVVLPNILAGVLSIPLLYALVKRYFGAGAGLLAGLVLAVTPVAIAADRNNTMDTMLTFTLLLGAWAFMQATDTGKSRYLWLGAVVVGLAFNIKMLQAFIQLPAFYALYLFGSKQGWWRKIANLALATLILLVVSLSWALVVDSIPADQRPYIGSSEDNTVMELILGHNGASRLFGANRGGDAPAGLAQGAPNVDDRPLPPLPNQDGPGQLPPIQGRDGPGAFPPNQNPGAQGSLPPLQGQDGPAPFRPPQDAQGGGASTMFAQETGLPGVFRFFKTPLAKEMSWLLPFALVSVGLVAVSARPTLPVTSKRHKGFLLWGGWLLTCVVFFSAINFFHAYYMVMLAPALGAAVGGGAMVLHEWFETRKWLAAGILSISAALTTGFQIYLAGALGVTAWWLGIGVVLLIAGLGMLGLHLLDLLKSKAWRWAGFGTVVAAMLAIPLVWTALTVADDNPNINLPSAYAGELEQGMPGGRPDDAPAQDRAEGQSDLLNYLQANTQDVEYLVAVQRAGEGAPMVLATGRPVLYMGGFSGGDPVVDAEDLAEMVQNGELRFVLYGGQNPGREQGIGTWLQSQCSVVKEFSQGAIPNNPGGNGGMTLYRCD